MVGAKFGISILPPTTRAVDNNIQTNHITKVNEENSNVESILYKVAQCKQECYNYTWRKLGNVPFCFSRFSRLMICVTVALAPYTA